jgi:hypothetical protein
VHSRPHLLRHIITVTIITITTIITPITITAIITLITIAVIIGIGISASRRQEHPIAGLSWQPMETPYPMAGYPLVMPREMKTFRTRRTWLGKLK